MEFHNFHVAMAQLEQLLPHVKTGVQEAEAASKGLEEMEKKKMAAETGYRIAVAERTKLDETIAFLQQKHAKMSTDLDAQYAEKQAKLDAQIEESRARSVALIQQHTADAKKAEDAAVKRLAEASIDADAVEARVAKAEAALAALKGA